LEIEELFVDTRRIGDSNIRLVERSKENWTFGPFGQINEWPEEPDGEERPRKWK
jgi:hypothetical protein